MSEGEFKLLSELRVTELKTELDKRGLDKNGIKVLLTDRLEKALQSEGHDPATFKFCISEGATPITSPLTSPAKGKEDAKAGAEATTDSVEVAGVDEVPKQGEEESTTVQPENGDAEGEDEEEEEEEQNEEEQLEDPLNEPPPEQEKKPTKAPESSQLNDPERMLWVHGLTSSTKAADLRELFSQHGKVVRAKIFTSKKVPGKTFGLITVNDPEMLTKCINAHHNQKWNGTTITLEKGNANKTRTTSAAVASVNKNLSKTGEGKKDEKSSRSNDSKKDDDGKERDKKDADRVRSRREPIKAPRNDKRRIIPAAVRRPVVSNSRRPAASSRLSRPSTATRRTSDSRSSRTEPYRREESDRERLRAREEELRRKAAQLELDRERERLRAERAKIEKEKMELELLKKDAQLAAYREKSAHAPSSRRDHSEPSRHVTSSSRHDDRYSSRAGGDAHRAHDRAPISRDRSARGEERRPVASNGDRSRSRHDSHRGEPTRPRDARFNEPRRDGGRTTGGSSNFNGPRAFATREPVTGGQNFYESRSTYAAPSRDFEHGSRVAPASSTWATSAGNWPGVSGSNWDAKNSASSSWNSYGGSSSANPTNVRIDYEKYHRQRQF